jgi:long-subunit fatty acid transport protein
LDGHWLSILGYESGFFGAKYNFDDVYHSAFGQWKNNIWNPVSPVSTTLRIGESGSINEYNFALATNISDFLFLGTTLNVTSIEYRMSSWHEEDFGGKDYLLLGNTIETEGTGFAINVGAIIRPINQLRFGIAYNSPKWFAITDHFDAFGESNIASERDPYMEGFIPEYSFAEYRLQTPSRTILSAAGIIGQSALISVDYELTNYNSMFLSDKDWNRSAYKGDNDIIKDDFRVSHTLKIGAEVKVTPQFAIRGGFVWQQTPVKDHLMNNTQVVYTAGTIPHFTVSNCASYYTAGLGYRFTPNFYMDIAMIYRTQSEKLYPFSSTSSEWNYPEYHLEPVHSQPAEISLKTMRAALTLGYKF